MTTIRKSMTSAMMRYLVLGALALSGGGFFWLFQAERSDAVPASAAIFIGDTTITVQIARTYEEKVLGLSGRAALTDAEGLLFWNAKDDFHPIWMRAMRFPIDIFWIAADGRIVDIKENAEPESYPEIFRPREVARYVLEVNAGFALRHDVNIGARIPLPNNLY